MEEWLQEAKKMVAALTPKSAEAAAPGPDCPGQLDAEGTTGSVLSATEMQVARETSDEASLADRAEAPVQQGRPQEPGQDADSASVAKAGTAHLYLEEDFEDPLEEAVDVGVDEHAAETEQQLLLSSPAPQPPIGSEPLEVSQTEEPASALQTSMKRTLGASATIASYADDFEELEDAEGEDSDDEE